MRPFAVGCFDRIDVARIVDHSVQCHFAFCSVGLVFFKTGIGEKLCSDIEKFFLFFFEVHGFGKDFVPDSFDGYTRFLFHSDCCGQFISVSPNRDLGLLLLSAMIIEVGTARVVFHLSGGKSVALDEHAERIGHAVVHVATECGSGASSVDGGHLREDRCSVRQKDVFQGAGRFSEIVAEQQIARTVRVADDDAVPTFGHLCCQGQYVGSQLFRVGRVHIAIIYNVSAVYDASVAEATSVGRVNRVNLGQEDGTVQFTVSEGDGFVGSRAHDSYFIVDVDPVSLE